LALSGFPIGALLHRDFQSDRIRRWWSWCRSLFLI
jgi:hypothetical protein